MAKALGREEFMSRIDEFLKTLKFAEKADNTVKKYDLGIRTFVDYATSMGAYRHIKRPYN